MPLFISCKRAPANAIFKIAWSVGERWSYADCAVARTPTGWRVAGDVSTLRRSEATRERIVISFPKSIAWEPGQPIHCTVQLTTLNGRAFPALKYVAATRSGNPAPRVTSVQTG